MAEPARAVAHAEPTGQVVHMDGASLMTVIARLASDPNADIDKFERLVALQQQQRAHDAMVDFDNAMSAAQEEMRRIATDANNPQTHSKYATYAALDRELRPIYTKHGFSLSFYQGEGAPADMVRVACRVARGGHIERPYLDMPADGKGAKGGDVMTKTHATGAALTYGRRYLLGMIFNIAIGKDDDGNGASDRGGSGAKQAATAAVNACKTLDELRAWKTKNADGLKLMPSDEADEVVRLVNDRMRRLKDATGQ